jgi:hypothetical protein
MDILYYDIDTESNHKRIPNEKRLLFIVENNSKSSFNAQHKDVH